MKNLLTLLTFSYIVSFAKAQSADSSAYFFEKGIAEKTARRFREAEKNFARAAEFDSKNINALLEWGQVLLEQKRYAEALEKFGKVEQLDANNPAAIENLATLSVNMHKWEQGIKYAKKVQQLKINKPVNLILANCYYEMEYFAEAIKFCELAFKEEPKNAQIPYIAARCFMEMSNYKRSAGCYEQALALDSTKAVWMYEAGLMWYAVPDDKKALFWIQKAGEKGYPKSNDYIENLASAYLNAGYLDKGIQMLQEVLQRKPEDQELLYDIADAYYKSKKYEEAIDYWDKLLTIDKTNANALYMIGMSYQKKGDEQKGAQLCDKAIQMDPSLRNLKQERKMPGF